MEAVDSSFSVGDQSPDSEHENRADATDQGKIDKRQAYGPEIKIDNVSINSDNKGDVIASEENEDTGNPDTIAEIKNQPDTSPEPVKADPEEIGSRKGAEGNEHTVNDRQTAPEENGSPKNTEVDEDKVNDKQDDAEVDQSSDANDQPVQNALEIKVHDDSGNVETVEIHSAPVDRDVKEDDQELKELVEEAEQEEDKRALMTEDENNSEKSELEEVQIEGEIEEADDTVTDADDQRAREEEDEAETYLLQHTAEKQVMHELIDETIVLEKDMGSLHNQVESTEKEKIELQKQVDTLTQENETQKEKIEQLEFDLKEAKMGDGEQRRLLEETQLRVQDLEGQLKRMVSDDEEKSKKLAKAEKDVLDLTAKCRKLESESVENPQSKTCVVM